MSNLYISLLPKTEISNIAQNVDNPVFFRIKLPASHQASLQSLSLLNPPTINVN